MGPALALSMTQWLGHWGAMSVLSNSKFTTGESRALFTFGWGNLTSLQRYELPPPPPPKKKKVGKQTKNGVSLMKGLFSSKNRIFSFEKGMLPFLKGRGIEKF